MKVKLNDLTIETSEGATLKDVMEQAGISPTGIAVAVNSVVIPAAEHANKVLSDGDSVLIIKAFYGG